MVEEEEKFKETSFEWDLELTEFPSKPIFKVQKVTPRTTHRPPSNRACQYHKWTKEEDEKLKELAVKHNQDWKTIVQYFQDKTTTSLKKRWDLRHNPNTKKSHWTPEEDQAILRMRQKLGGGYWKAIAKHLPGRPPDAIKNRFYSALRKNFVPQAEKTDVFPVPENESSDTEIDEDGDNCDEEGAMEMLNLQPGTVPTSRERPQSAGKLSSEEKNMKIQELKGTLETLEQLLVRTKAEMKLISDEINSS